MFFDLFINIEVKFEDDDYKIFEQSIIDMYNIDNIQYEFNDELKYIKLLQYKYVDLSLPDLVIDYEDKIGKIDTYNVSDPTFFTVKKREETKDELLEYYHKFKIIFDNSLGYAEKIIFIDFFILKKGRESIKDRLRIGNERFKVIKNSCLIKFALGLEFENVRKSKEEN